MELIEYPRVRHGIFGDGVVLGQRHHGHEYLVRFPNSLELWIKKPYLIFLGNISYHKKPPQRNYQLKPEIRPQARVSPENRSVIEAFRLGIVPYQAVRKWTVGRAREMETVQQWLKDESSGTMLIRGEYGSGKTHLIEYLHASGFELNYAISLVNIDPCDAQPGFPKRIYRHLIQNLRFPYQGRYYNFRETLKIIVQKYRSDLLKDHRFLNPVLEKIREGKDSPEMWEWIEGQETNYRELGPLYDHTTAANIYCYILSGISRLTVKGLGLKGILLMFDEAETSRTYRYLYEWHRALNFFNALSMVANDEPDLEEETVIKGDYFYYGKNTGLIYSGHIPIPYIYQLPSFLKVVFAFTPDFKLNFTQGYNIYEIELESLPPQQMEYLFYRFLELYGQVYQLHFPKNYRRRLFELVKANSYNSTRRFIKAMVECLDFHRFYPSLNIEYLFTHDIPIRDP
jgi:hypothetical protein